MVLPQLYLFGGDKPWELSKWTSSDDRVRGGKSQSHLICRDDGSSAEFSGHLDIKTLGGAGFASQRTIGGGEDDDVPSPVWDISAYGSLVLDVAHADDKKYTITLKDEIVPKRPDGRDQSTLSWEYDFVVGSSSSDNPGTKLVIPLDKFEPTYRGRAKPDAEPLDLKHIRRISFMMRSFFGTQEGDFSIVLNSLAADNSHSTRDASIDSVAVAKQAQQQRGDGCQKGHLRTGSSWLGWLCGRSK